MSLVLSRRVRNLRLEKSKTVKLTKEIESTYKNANIIQVKRNIIEEIDESKYKFNLADECKMINAKFHNLGVENTVVSNFNPSSKNSLNYLSPTINHKFNQINLNSQSNAQLKRTNQAKLSSPQVKRKNLSVESDEEEIEETQFKKETIYRNDQSKLQLKIKNDFNPSSPREKRKEIVIESDDGEIKQSQKRPHQEMNKEIESINKINTNVERNLHDELMLIYKSKKNKDKMIPIIEQTFKYRRSLIESSNCRFDELINQFKYLIDVKNVRLELLSNNLLLITFVFNKLESEFAQLVLKPIFQLKLNFKKIMLILWENFKISNTVN